MKNLKNLNLNGNAFDTDFVLENYIKNIKTLVTFNSRPVSTSFANKKDSHIPLPVTKKIKKEEKSREAINIKERTLSKKEKEIKGSSIKKSEPLDEQRTKQQIKSDTRDKTLFESKVETDTDNYLENKKTKILNSEKPQINNKIELLSSREKFNAENLKKNEKKKTSEKDSKKKLKSGILKIEKNSKLVKKKKVKINLDSGIETLRKWD